MSDAKSNRDLDAGEAARLRALLRERIVARFADDIMSVADEIAGKYPDLVVRVQWVDEDDPDEPGTIEASIDISQRRIDGFESGTMHVAGNPRTNILRSAEKIASMMMRDCGAGG